ncbi:MAG: four helix bundle protein, partial [Bacteroidales bacterium]|nr:four helix bundle protein [Bacteroidales bacterium]
MKLENLEIYTISMQLSDEIWACVAGWDYFHKKAIGSQLVTAADSVSANISEGCGRYF